MKNIVFKRMRTCLWKLYMRLFRICFFTVVGLQFWTLSCKFSLFWAQGCDKFAIRVQAEMQNAVVGRRSIGASRSAIVSSSASSSHSASLTSTSSLVYSATALPALAFWLLLQSSTLLKSPTSLLIYPTPRNKFWQWHLPLDGEGNLFIENEGKRGCSILLNQGWPFRKSLLNVRPKLPYIKCRTRCSSNIRLFLLFHLCLTSFARMKSLLIR